jgi:4-amino-4-deoxychorismate lyase
MLVDGVATTQIQANDRGLLYGDGVFETILFVHGRAPLWTRHVARLHEACARLALPVPDTAQLEREAAQVCAGLARAVVRVTLTRGSGERGYAPPRPAQSRRIVSATVAAEINPDWYRRGIRVRWCDTRLAAQPRLAGIKHLNRLENVLARAEWNDADIAEGLLRDEADNVIGATAANVFAVIDGQLRTPALYHCGVAGVMRAQVLAWRTEAQVQVVATDELMRASEVFLTNAVRGVLPVRELDGATWSVGPVAAELISRCRACGLLPQETA